MLKATISADIINSTSLTEDDTVRLNSHLKAFIKIAEHEYHGCWGRIVRGDGIEFVMPYVKDVMRLAVMLICHVKALNVNFGSFTIAGSKRRIPRFGVRVVIGIGDLWLNDKETGLIAGDAIYNSGRKLTQISSMIRGRSTLVVVGWDSRRRETMQALLSLIDVLVTHATAKQCDIMVKRLLGLPEQVIAEKIGITQSAVNTHLRRVGGHAILSAIEFFENGLCQ